MQSAEYGIQRYEFSVGTAAGVEDIQPFTSDGIVLVDDDMGRGGPGMRVQRNRRGHSMIGRGSYMLENIHHAEGIVFSEL